MSAYLNKNTFSSATALPPEENRLNFLDIISKGSNPIWQRNQPEESKDSKSKFSHRRPNQTEEDIQNQIQLANCSKCGQGKCWSRLSDFNFWQVDTSLTNV